MYEKWGEQREQGTANRSQRSPRNRFGSSGVHPRQFRNSSRPVPVRDIDISVSVDEAAVGRTECRRTDCTGFNIVIRPLCLLRIVAEKRDRDIVAIKDRSAPL